MQRRQYGQKGLVSNVKNGCVLLYGLMLIVLISA